MCVQAELSVVSSKRPSGVAAELEWDRVAELGDAAMADTFGATRPGHATRVEIFPHLPRPTWPTRELRCLCAAPRLFAFMHHDLRR